jgi:hypothetical protein
MSWTYWIGFVTFDARRKPAKRLSMRQIFKNLPEPIDPELNLANRTIDWNDQRDSPLGNTVNPAPVDVSAGDAPQVLLGGLQEAIGLVLDLTNRQIFFNDPGGSRHAAAVYDADLRLIFGDQGHLTGIAYAEPVNRTSSGPFIQRRVDAAIPSMPSRY